MVAFEPGVPFETPIEELKLATRVTKLLKRADVQRIGELALFTEAGFLALRDARPRDWTVVEQAVRSAGIDRATVPLVYLILAPSLQTVLFHYGIRRLGDLLGLTEAEVHALPGMSTTEVDDIQRSLAIYGLQLRDEAPG